MSPDRITIAGATPGELERAAPATAPDPLRRVRLALAVACQDAAQIRDQSRLLHARATGAARAATATCDLVHSHRRLWATWHRTWAVLAGAGSPRLLCVCASCGGAVHAPPDAGDVAGRWGPVPPDVHDRLRAGTLGLHPTHGLCPTCATTWAARA